MGGEEPAGSGIPPALLAAMRREFEYWYPFDLRVSGKDLIQVCVGKLFFLNLIFLLWGKVAGRVGGGCSAGARQCSAGRGGAGRVGARQGGAGGARKRPELLSSKVGGGFSVG